MAAKEAGEVLKQAGGWLVRLPGLPDGEGLVFNSAAEAQRVSQWLRAGAPDVSGSAPTGSADAA